MRRTPEQIAEARARVFAGAPEPRALPPGKSLEEVLVGQLADDKSRRKFWPPWTSFPDGLRRA